MSMNPKMEPLITTCGNFTSTMPTDLRFCRNCGYRLGEGSAEYTETVRFQNVPPGTSYANGPASPFPPYAAPVGTMAAATGRKIRKRCGRMSGMTWMFLGLLIFFIAAAGFTAIVRPIRQNIRAEIAQAEATRYYLGIRSFYTPEGGD